MLLSSDKFYEEDFFQIQTVETVWVAIGAFGNLQESKKFPVPNCVTRNRASNFFGNFWKFPGTFFETVSLVIGLESVWVAM